MLRRVLTGLIVTVAMAGAAVAGPFEDAEAAYRRGDYTTAFNLWRPLAEQGDAYAQDVLGIMYVGGLGVPEDDAEAVKWYRRAADQGLAIAESALGIMYEQGHGVPRDYAEAVRCYRLAVEQGLAMAQTHLGDMYYRGLGV